MSVSLTGVLTLSSILGCCQLLVERGVTPCLQASVQSGVLASCSLMTPGQLHTSQGVHQHAVTIFVSMLAVLL